MISLMLAIFLSRSMAVILYLLSMEGCSSLISWQAMFRCWHSSMNCSFSNYYWVKVSRSYPSEVFLIDLSFSFLRYPRLSFSIIRLFYCSSCGLTHLNMLDAVSLSRSRLIGWAGLRRDWEWQIPLFWQSLRRVVHDCFIDSMVEYYIEREGRGGPSIVECTEGRKKKQNKEQRKQARRRKRRRRRRKRRWRWRRRWRVYLGKVWFS